jgi:general secretion pathway protein K
LIAPRRRKGGRGFALLIVLWALVLLSLVFTQIVAAGRSQTNLAANLRAAAVVRTEADGMLYQAIFHVLDPSPAGWPADGATRTVRLAGASAAITVVDLAGRINPNTAPAPLLAALLAQLGADRTTAQAIAAACPTARRNRRFKAWRNSAWSLA